MSCLRNFKTGINGNYLCSTSIFPCPMLIGFHFGLCLIVNEKKLTQESCPQDSNLVIMYMVWFWVPIVIASFGGGGEVKHLLIIALMLALVNSLYC